MVHELGSVAVTPHAYARQAALLRQFTDPVLDSWSNGTLLQAMHPADFQRKTRQPFTSLEVVARVTYGLLGASVDGECIDQRFLAGLETSLCHGHPQAFNWNYGRQPLVDAAILAAAFLQHPQVFETKIPLVLQDALLLGWKRASGIVPHENNWILFSAVLEAAVRKWGHADFSSFGSGVGYRLKSALTSWKRTNSHEMISYSIRRFEDWYQGTGWYSDGPRFRKDYYNSIIIHPFLLLLADLGYVNDELHANYLQRARQHARFLKDSINAEGTFPAVGRSLCYRAGLFHLLAYMLRHQLFESESETTEARILLNLVVMTTSHVDSNGDPGAACINPHTKILKPGLFHWQPHLAEAYISTASLYVHTWAFLPLGLGQENPVWRWR